MKKVIFKKIINCDIDNVFNLVCNLSDYGWRSDIEKITVQDEGKTFIEHTKKGYQTTFNITNKIKNDTYEFDIKNSNLSGHWCGKFIKLANGTKVEFTEEVQVKNPIMNLFITNYIKKQQSKYLSDLVLELNKNNR